MLCHEFLQWEQASRDTIDVKRAYIDLAGDLVTGILLSQIVYWFLPADEAEASKLRVERENRLWLAKLRSDWWNECRISPKQFDRSIAILRDKGLVETKRFQFRGATPTLHIWLNIPSLVQGVKSILPKGENGNSLKGEKQIDVKAKSSTETTNIDYLTEISISNISPQMKLLLYECVKLPYWGKGDLEVDSQWLVWFTTQYPSLCLKDIVDCRNNWDGRRAKHRGVWKTRLKNWMEHKNNFVQQPKRYAAKPSKLPNGTDLDDIERRIKVGSNRA